MESLKIAASKILSNSWKQELNITENGVESEIFRTGTREKKNLQYEKIAEVIIRNGAFAATLEIVNTGGSNIISITGLKKKDAAKAKALIEKNIEEIKDPVKQVQKMIKNGTIKPPEPYRTKVAGVTYGNRQTELEDCWDGQELIIRNKPSAKYPHAMAVYAIDDNDKKHMLGYVQDDLAKDLYEGAEYSGNWDTDDDNMTPQYTGRIVEITGGTEEKPTYGCNIEIDK